MKTKAGILLLATIIGLVGLFKETNGQTITVTDDDTYTPEASAMLDVKSTDKGMLIPRLTTTQREGISSPAEGLVVYDSDLDRFYYYNGSSWIGMPNENVESTDTSVTLSKQLLFEGDAVVWDDLTVPVTSTQSFGTKSPTYYVFANDGSGSQGVFLWYFSPSQEQELYFTVQLPHSWKVGSTLEPHIHWTPYHTGGTGDVVWGLEYTWASVGDDFSYTTITTGTSSVPSTIEHSICDLGSMDGTGKGYSSMIVCRVFRDATNAADTYDDYACLLEIDFHYQISSLGTTSEY